MSLRALKTNVTNRPIIFTLGGQMRIKSLSCLLTVSFCLGLTPGFSAAPAVIQTAETAPVPVGTPRPETTTVDQWSAWMIEAAKAAQDYVQLIDQGRYAESWTSGAKIFQGTITQKEWETALKMARKRLGDVKSRTVKDERPAWDPKGLPKGPYMVVEYNTSFTRAPQSGELLTLMREPNGSWKVLTYQVN